MKKIVLIFCLIISYLSIKSQTELNTVWLNGFGGAGDDKLHNSFVDASGNIYIAGETQYSLDIDPGPPYTTVTVNNVQGYFSKFSPNGTMLWSRHFDGESVATSEADAITVDANGNVYVAGIFENGNVDFNLASPGTNSLTCNLNAKDMFIVKYSPSGTFISLQAIGNSSANVIPTRMKFDANGDLVIAGHLYQDPTALVDFNPAGPAYTVATNGNGDGFVAKYNSSGVLQFAIAFGSGMNDYCYGMDIDASNNVYVTGFFQNGADFDPTPATYTLPALGSEALFIAKYNSTGGMVWANGIGGSNGDGGFRLKLDNNNDILVTGYMASASMDADPSPTVTMNLTKVGTGLTDAFIGKYNSTTGNLIWAKNTGGTGEMYSYGVTNDAQNNIYVIGAFSGVNDFDLTTAVNNQTAVTAGGGDAYLAKYTSTGDYIYAYPFGGGASGANEAYEVQITSNNDVLFGGMYIASFDFDPSISSNSLISYGGKDVFYNRYSQCISPDTPTLTVSSLTICANTIATLSIAGGNLNSATNWVWTSVACGSSTMSVGATATVSPPFLTTYFVRGEGGCPTPTGSCASVTVSVTPSKDITGTVTTATSVPVPGYVILYRYEGPLTKWDSVTYQNINASGDYTFNAVNSTSYVLMALPGASSLQTTYAPNAIFWKDATVFGHGCNNNTTLNVDVIPITDLGGGPGELSGKITEGVGYGNRSMLAPGNPIGGLNIKGGKNPGGGIVAQSRTNSAGEYTLSGLPINAAGEDYFIIVDIPGLDTNGTFRRAIVTGSIQYTDLDFVVDSQYVNPIVYTGIKEININKHAVIVYPNPTKDLIHVSFNTTENSNVEVELVDLFGRTVSKNNFENILGNFNSSADMSALSKGIYFIRIKINEEERRVKIVLTD